MTKAATAASPASRLSKGLNSTSWWSVPKGISAFVLIQEAAFAATTGRMHMIKERLAAIEDSLRRQTEPDKLRPVPPIRLFSAPAEGGTLTLAEYLEMLVKLMR